MERSMSDSEHVREQRRNALRSMGLPTRSEPLMPDRGGALREEPHDRIPVPLGSNHRVMLMTVDEARTLRDWLVANVPDTPSGDGA
jgi:hypothetical protein